LAEIDCRRGDWKLALDHLRRSLARNTENLGAHNLNALVLRKLGREVEAREELDAVAALDPLDIVHRYLRSEAVPQDGQQSLDLGFDLLRAGFVEEAERLAAAAIPLARMASAPDGSVTMLRYMHAHIKSLSGQDVTVAAMDAAAADPMYVFPHRLEEMLLLQEAVSRGPADAHANLFLGNLLYDKRRHEEAIGHWSRAVELDGSLTTAWRNLAVGEFNVHHDGEAALAAFARARMCDPQDVRLLYEFDQLLKRLGRSPRERLKRLEEQWELVSRRDDLSVEAASLLSSMRRPQAALNLLLSRQFQPWEGGEGATLGQYMRAHLLLAVDCLEAGDDAFAREHLLQALDPPASLAECRHVLMNVSKYFYWLGVAMERAGDPAAAAEWERAARERTDFEQMEVKEISEATYWSGVALQRLGREDEARELFAKILAYAEELESKPATVDFFATSLPTMLLFEEDPADRQKTTATFLKVQAKIGLGQDAGKMMLQNVLARDPNHTGALDMLRLMER
jgi:tetratricopeptide (TPR) repeat protein